MNTQKTHIKTNAVTILLMIVLSLLAVSIIVTHRLSPTAAGDVEVWDGSAATAFAGGTGTYLDPYRISNGRELQLLADFINNAEYNASNKFYRMTNDIYLNDPSLFNVWSDGLRPKNLWTPMGYNTLFRANFDGNGYAIKGMYINYETSGTWGGLFCNVAGNISNLGVEQSYIYGIDCTAGGIAAQLSGGSITNCYNTGSIRTKVAGGIVGSVIGGNITNCYNTGSIAGNYVGGIAGELLELVTIYDCYNTGTVTGSFGNGSAGGIASSVTGYSTITDSYNLGAVNGLGNAGGIAGSVTSYSKVYDSYNAGSVTGHGNYVGGIAAHVYTDAQIRNSYNTGSLGGTSDAGGIAGLVGVRSEIVNCYNAGSIVGMLRGGIVGQYIDDGQCVISHSYYLDTSINRIAGTGLSVVPNQTGPFNSEWALLPPLSGNLLTELNAYILSLELEEDHGYLGWNHRADSPFPRLAGLGPDDAPKLSGLPIWNGTVTPIDEGTGAYDDPFLINSAEQLWWLRTQLFIGADSYYNSLSVHYKLTANIHLNNTEDWASWSNSFAPMNFWHPIGAIGGDAFNANFDGGGFTVYGVYIANNDGTGGLFGNVSGTIRNLGVEKSYIRTNVAGGIAGFITNGARIFNCYVENAAIRGTIDAGGIVGVVGDGAVVENCYVNGTVSGGQHVGGIVSRVITTGSIGNSYFYGEIVGSPIIYGGIAGEIMTSFGTVYKCYYFYGAYSGVQAVGGEAHGVVTECYAFAVTGDTYVIDSHILYELNSVATGPTGIVYDYATWTGTPFPRLTGIGGKPDVEAFLGWDGTAGDSFAGGSGTEADPYLISDAYELAYLRDLVNAQNATYNASTVYYALTANIYLNDTSSWQTWSDNVSPDYNWTPIGAGLNDTSTPFRANLDGQGYAVRGVYMKNNSVASTRYGLFGQVDGGNISNLGVEQSYIKTNEYVAGGIAAYISGTSSVTNCYFDGYLWANEQGGGIVGYATGNVSITDCYSAGVVYCNNQTGGIVGDMTGGSITSSYNTASVSGYGAEIGGIAGIADSVSISSCYNTGDVDGSAQIGGIVGAITDGTISACYNTGSVTNKNNINSYSGGIAGYATGTVIVNTYNTGTITNGNYNGGLVGYLASDRIVNCFNTGTLDSPNVGGIAGYAGNNSQIENCYNNGAHDSLRQGGIVYNSESAVGIYNCFYIESYAGAVYSGDPVIMGGGAFSLLDEFLFVNELNNFHEENAADEPWFTFESTSDDTSGGILARFIGEYPTFTVSFDLNHNEGGGVTAPDNISVEPGETIETTPATVGGDAERANHVTDGKWYTREETEQGSGVYIYTEFIFGDDAQGRTATVVTENTELFLIWWDAYEYRITKPGADYVVAKTVEDGIVNIGTDADIQDIIDLIKWDADANDVTIIFGDGVNALDIGMSGIEFNNTGTAWGEVTLEGELFSANTHAISVINNIEISVRGTLEAYGDNDGTISVQNGTVTIDGGKVVSSSETGYAIKFTSNNGSLVLAGNPVIDGRIYLPVTKISFSNTFNPDSMYHVEFSNPSNGIGAILNGADYIDNFKCVNENYKLKVGDDDLADDLLLQSTVNVIFNTNGGTGTAPATQVVDLGGKAVTKPSSSGITRAGYTTDGEWYTRTETAQGSGVYVYTKFVFGTTVVSAHTTLYLVWTNDTTGLEYRLSGNTSAYTLTKIVDGGTVTMATGTGNLAAKLALIQADANGAACTIHFGSADGTQALSIGTSHITFDSTNWGTNTVTITGKLSATTNTANSGAVVMQGAMNLTSSADIHINSAATGETAQGIAAIRNGGTGTLTISGGELVSDKGYAVISASTGNLVLTGSPTIPGNATTGAISVPLGKLSVGAGFNPGTKTYLVNLTGVVSAGAIAVTGGSSHLANFELNGDNSLRANNGNLTVVEYVASVTSPTASGNHKYGSALSTWTLSGTGWVWVSGTAVPTVTNSGYSAVWDVTSLVDYDYSSVSGYAVDGEGVKTITRTGIAVTVTQRTLNITADGKTKVYDTTDPDLTYTITGDGLFGTDTLTGSLARVSGANVGTYAINQGTLAVATAVAGNYTVSFTAGEFEITKATGSVTAPTASGSYAYGTTLGNWALSDNNWTWVDGTAVPEVGGSGYAAKITVDDGNYNFTGVPGYDAETHTVTRTIAVTVTQAAPPTITTVTPTASGSHTYGNTLSTWTLSGGGWTWADGTQLPTVTNSGYAAVIVVDDENYNYTGVEGYDPLTHSITRTVALVSVTKAAGSVTAPTTANAFVYGTALSNWMLSGTGWAWVDGTQVPTVVNSGYAAVISVDDDNYDFTDVTGYDAGSGTVTVTVTGVTVTRSTNFPSGSITTPSAIGSHEYGTALSEWVLSDDDWSWTDDTAVPTVGNSGYTVVITVDDGNYNYTGVQGYDPLTHTVTRTVLVTVTRKLLDKPTAGTNALPFTGGLQTYTPDGFDPDTMGISGNTGTGAGGYTATVTLLDAVNYGWVGGGSVTLSWSIGATVIEQNDLGDSLDISGINASYTYTGGDIEPTLTVTYNGDALTYETDYTVGYAGNKNAGTATVTITFIGNYSGAVTLTFAITPATLTVTADSGQSKVYGEDDPAFTYSITGWLGSDGEALLDGALTRESGTDVGNYNILQGTLSAGGNYTINFVGATFEITPATLTVTVDAGQSKVYGDSDPTFGYTASGWVGTADESLLDGALTRQSGENVGNYNITIGDLSAGGNYTINFVGATFAITPATLTVTANSGQSKTYGDSDPTFGYTASGWVGTDDEDLLDGALTRQSGTDVGNYNILLGTLSAGGNYTIVFTTATFEITPATLTVTANSGQSKVYGDNDPTTFTYTTDDDSVVLSGALSRASGEDVDTYAITIGDLSAGGNYNINLIGATFAITPKTLNVYAYDGQSKTYGASDPTITYTQSDNSVILFGALSRESGEDAGKYTILMGSLSAGGNYTIVLEFAEFTIIPATLTVTADSGQSKTYGDSDPTLTYTATGWVGTDDEALITGALSRVSGEKAGFTYDILRGTLSAGDNYTIVFIDNIPFAIDPQSIGQGDVGDTLVIGNIPDMPYTGSWVEPTPSVTYDGKTLGEGTDFMFSYDNNIDAGDAAELIITFMGNYSGVVRMTFTILSGATVIIPGDPLLVIEPASIPDQKWTGSGIEPGVTSVMYDGVLLFAGTDYTISYADNVDVSYNAKTIITFIGDYSGSVILNFRIYAEVTEPGDPVVEIEPIADQKHTGSEITPAVVVKYDGAVLTEGLDYTVEYADNIAVGDNAKAVITFTKGGAVMTVTFRIVREAVIVNPFDPDLVLVPTAIPDQQWTGSGIEPGVTSVMYDGVLLIAGTEYTVSYENNVDVGTAKMIITFLGDYGGSISLTFRIYVEVTDPGDPEVEIGAIADQQHTGSAITPAVVVKYDGVVLTEGVDYTVAYQDNIAVGDNAKAVITFTEGGAVMTVTFRIVSELIDDPGEPLLEINPDEIPAQKYTGSEIKPVVTLTYNGVLLDEGTDYTLAYADNVAVGMGKVIIIFLGDYGGSITLKFEIYAQTVEQNDLGDSLDISGINASYTYTGGDIEPTLTVTYNGNALTYGTDYTVGYAGNKNAGTATVTITFIGNYSGTVTLTFTITPATLTVTADSGQRKVYGEDDPTFEYSASGWLGSDGEALLDGALKRDSGSNVGTYDILLGTLTAGGNYIIDFTSAEFSITPKMLNVTANSGQSKVYGEDDPTTFTYTTDDDSVTLSGALSRQSGTDVGNYDILIGSLSAGSNYIINFIPATFAITPKTLNVTADAGQSKVYGSNDPTITYTTDDNSVTLNGVLSRVSGEDAGAYKILVGSLSAGGNYTIVLEFAEFTITPATLTVTADSGQSKVYGEDDPTLTYTTDDNSVTLNGALSRVSGSDVGTYNIVIGTLSAGDNYIINLIPATFAITPKTLNVTANAGQGKVYGENDPALTYTASGWVGSDTSALLTGALTRDQGSNVGTYNILQGTLAAGGNYTISFTSAVFTITQAEPSYTVPTLSAVTYDPNRTLAQITLPPGWTWVNVSLTPTVGNSGYSATYTPTDPNYASKTITISLTVNPLLLAKPTASGATELPYNGALQTLALTGFDAATMNISGNTGTNAGSYTAVITLKDANNYGWIGGGSVSISWSIVEAAITGVTFSGGEWTYDGIAKQAALSGTLGGDTVTYRLGEDGAFTNAHPSVKNAGTYTVYVKIERTGYTTLMLDAMIFINKAVPATTAPAPDAITYSSGRTLGNIALPDGWAWDDATAVPTVKNNGYSATYTHPDEPDNYVTVTVTIQLTVSKAAASEIPSGIIDTPAPGGQEYGSKLSEWGLPEGWEWLPGDKGKVPGYEDTKWEAVIDVSEWDDNYDFTDVEGYDKDTHTVRRSVSIEVNIPKGQENAFFWFMFGGALLMIGGLIVLCVLIKKKNRRDGQEMHDYLDKQKK